MTLEALGPNDPMTVGNYQLTAVLGSGGMGRVYLAHSPSGRRVAIKVIQADLVQDPEIRQRFAREVAASRAVSGLFTAGVVDADLDADSPWLVTTFIPGPSLSSAVRQVGPLPLATVRAIGAALAEALSAIHAAGLIHRDLKPGNILLAADGPRLIDFGISALTGSRTLTRLGAIMGSPGYMSPEQIEGKAVGPPTDVFALGAVIVFAATGRGPFGGDSVPSLMYQTVHAPPDLSRVPDELVSLVTSCLDKDPARRPDLRTLLAEFTSGQNVASMFAPGWLPAALTRDAEMTVNPAEPATTPAQATEVPTTPAQPTEAPATPAEAATASAEPAEARSAQSSPTNVEPAEPDPADAPTTRPDPAEAPTAPPRPGPSPTTTGPGVPAVTTPATPVVAPALPVGRPAPPAGPPPAPWPYGQPGPATGTGRPTRGVLAAILVAVAVVGVGGCFLVSRALLGGTPSGDDPTTPVDLKAAPAVGTCHDAQVTAKFDPAAERARRVDCEQEHTLETIASGPVEADEPPGGTSAAARNLYARCETAARTFLGAQWRTTYTMLVLSLPSADAWRQGAHWYRCDLAASDFAAQQTTLPVTGSLKGRAKPITCLSFTYQGATLGDIRPSDCDAPHHGELAGLIRLPDPDLSGEALRRDLSDRCRPIVLRFLGASRLPNGLTYWFVHDDTPGTLDRNVLCLVATEQNRGTVVASLRGLGSRAIPFG